jgi:hypothetical protein
MEANRTQKISDDVYNVLCSQLLVTKAYRSRRREKRKRKKEALRLEREKGNRR